MVSLLVDVTRSSGGLFGCFRFRIVDVGSSVRGVAGFWDSGSCGARGAARTCSPSISSSSSGP